MTPAGCWGYFHNQTLTLNQQDTLIIGYYIIDFHQDQTSFSAGRPIAQHTALTAG